MLKSSIVLTGSLICLSLRRNSSQSLISTCESCGQRNSQRDRIYRVRANSVVAMKHNHFRAPSGDFFCFPAADVSSSSFSAAVKYSSLILKAQNKETSYKSPSSPQGSTNLCQH